MSFPAAYHRGKAATPRGRGRPSAPGIGPRQTVPHPFRWTIQRITPKPALKVPFPRRERGMSIPRLGAPQTYRASSAFPCVSRIPCLPLSRVGSLFLCLRRSGILLMRWATQLSGETIMTEDPVTIPAGASTAPQQCPICLRPMANPHRCKTLYGVTVCDRCRNGFANRRQAAYIVDVLAYVLGVQMLAVFLIRLMSQSLVAAQSAHRLVEVLLLFLTWVIFPFFFTFKDTFHGRSLGKMLFGVRVVNVATRQPITLAQSIKRNLILMIPYVGAIGGAITMMKGQRWGDRWAGTMVIWNKYAFREPFSPGGRYCRGCGYDLTGNVSGRCPECGLDIPTPAAPPLAAPATGREGLYGL